MKRVILMTCVGCLFALIGSGLFLYTLVTFKENAYHIGVLVAAFVSGGTSIFFLLRAKSMRKAYVEELAAEEKNNVQETFKSESIIEKQNELLSQWNETNQTRDKLKMLKMAANAGDE